MSTIIGHNPVTGSADSAKVNAAETEAKQAKAIEAARAKEIAAADREVISSLKAHEKTGERLAVALATARDLEVHRHYTDAETGKPFTSFTAYLQARTADFPLIHRIARKQLVADMLDHGASVRQIAAVTRASVGSVASDKAEIEAAKRDAGQAPAKTAEQLRTERAAAVARVVKGGLTALTKITDNVADMSDDELAEVMAALTDARSVVAATRKLRGDAAAKAAAKGQTKAPAAPAPAPAKVAQLASA